METQSRTEIGIELIRSKGSASGQELAEVLGCPKKNVQPTLYLALTKGYLATSKQGGSNIYRISEAVPGGMSWEEFKTSKRVPKVSTRAKPPPKAKEIVEKPERTPAEVRNALADLFERRALGLPADEDDATSSEVQAAPADAVGSAAQGYEVIELDTGPEPATAIAVPTIPASAQVETAAPIDEVLFLFGHDGRLQVIVGDQRIICTREETAAVGRMMSALEPVWNA
jgi:hypothetical protein